MSDERWRAVVAALANETTRRVYAELVLGAVDPGADLSPSRRRHAFTTLARSGLVSATDDDGRVRVDGGVFARVLREAPAAPRRVGVARFLRADGRIDRYPASAGDRHNLLRYVAQGALRPGEVIDERALGERLASYADDVATLRRYLVDAGLVERTATGTAYALVSDAS